MCLGVPGKILEITPGLPGMPMGRVSFGGVAKEVCLAYVPEAAVGDYVIVHAGFALNTSTRRRRRKSSNCCGRWASWTRLSDALHG